MLTFSNAIKYSGSISISPDSCYFAVSKGFDLVIYDLKSLKPCIKYNFIDLIEDIQWSNDSKLLLIGIYKRSICELKLLTDPSWNCRINEGFAGLTYATISPDSLNVLSFTESNIRLNIRSLVNGKQKCILYPKFNKKGMAFTSNGHFMSLVTREKSNDYINIYYCHEWKSICKFKAESEDLQDLKWTFDNSAILIQDNPALCVFFVYSPFGDLLKRIEPYKLRLGIRRMVISPNGHYITLGFYNQYLYVYNSVGYINMTILDMSEKELSSNKINYFQEKDIGDGLSKYIVLSPPIQLKQSTPDPDSLLPEEVPKIGVNLLNFSYDSLFLAAKSENSPNVLYIWEMMGFNLHTIIIQIDEIVEFKWAKNQHLLFLTTKNNKLYYFTLESCLISLVADNFSVENILLAPDGSKIILKNKEKFVVAEVNNLNPIYFQDNSNDLKIKNQSGTSGKEEIENEIRLQKLNFDEISNEHLNNVKKAEDNCSENCEYVNNDYNKIVFKEETNMNPLD